MSLPALRGLGCSSAFDGARIGFTRGPQLRCLVRSRFSSPALAAFSAAEVHDKAGVMGKQSLEDVLAAIRAFVPSMLSTKHKGQAGKIAVVGGCREYTGAPYFAAISALKMGADLSHVFCTNGAATVIKSYSPELIVHPILFESYEGGDKERSIKEVEKWLPRFDCLVIGPGLGRDAALLDCVADIIRRARSKNIPLVIDGDGLFLVTNDPDLVIGYPLAVLTPNVNEHKRLAEKMEGPEHEVKSDKVPEDLKSLAKRMGGVTILQKGSTDFISDGSSVLASDFFGAPRRCGGQGDVLSGSTAVFTSWARQALASPEGSSNQAVESLSTNPAMLGALAGSILVRKSAQAAFARHRRSTVTSNLIECLGESMDELCPL